MVGFMGFKMELNLLNEYNEYMKERFRRWEEKGYGDLFGRSPENLMFLEATFTKQFFLMKLNELGKKMEKLNDR